MTPKEEVIHRAAQWVRKQGAPEEIARQTRMLWDALPAHGRQYFCGLEDFHYLVNERAGLMEL